MKPKYRDFIDHKCDVVGVRKEKKNICIECKRTFKSQFLIKRDWFKILINCADKHNNFYMLAFKTKNLQEMFITNKELIENLKKEIPKSKTIFRVPSKKSFRITEKKLLRDCTYSSQVIVLEDNIYGRLYLLSKLFFK